MLAIKFDLYAQCNGTPIGASGVQTSLSTLISNSTFPSGSINGASFSIAGTLIADVNYAFYNCTFEMDAGSKIIVNPSITLTIEKSTLYACNGGTGNMWEGIQCQSNQLQDPSSLFVIDQSRIEDAMIAIYTAPLEIATIHIDVSNFANNYRHIYLNYDNPGGTISGMVPFISASNFSCSPSGLNPPLTGSITYAAIELDYCGVGTNWIYAFVGENGISSSINNAGYGIKLNRTSLVLNNWDILNCGKGIFIEFDSNHKVQDCEITDCNYGIESTSHNGFNSYYNNIISEVDFGIIVRNRCSLIQATGNTITNISQHGIFIRNCPASNTCSIVNNTINSAPYASNGITISEVVFPVGNYFVLNNQIDNVSRGITLKNIGRSIVELNNINNLSANNVTHGIKLENINDAVVESNSVSGVDDIQCNINTFGLMIDNCSQTVVKCNTTDNVGNGFWYGGATPNSTFIGNSMNRHQNQFYLYMNPNGLGNQLNNNISSQNHWFDAVCEDYSNTLSNASNISGFTTFFYNPGTFNFPSHNVNSSSGLKCNSNLSNIISQNFCENDPPNDLILLLEEIATEPDLSNTALETYQWNEMWYLYQTLLKEAALLDSSELLENTFDSLSLSNMALLDSVNNLLLTSDYINANLLNESMQSSTAAFLNAQKLNRFYILYSLYGDSALQNNNNYYELINLAHLCPYESGRAVFGARELLSMVDTTEYTYTNDCSGLSNRLTNFALQNKSKGKPTSNTNEIYAANGELHIVNKQSKIVEIIVYDIAGKIILQNEYLNTSTHSIAVDTYPKGMYLVRIKDEQNSITHKKIVL